MVDVSAKPVTVRDAVARAFVRVSPAARRAALHGAAPKGPVTEVARLAGILAAKRTADVIPLCHPVPLHHVDVDVRPARGGFAVEARVRTEAKTGAEMEALHAAAVAALTVYDMLKAVDKRMVVDGLCVVSKTGGQGGDFRRSR